MLSGKTIILVLKSTSSGVVFDLKKVMGRL